MLSHPTWKEWIPPFSASNTSNLLTTAYKSSSSSPRSSPSPIPHPHPLQSPTYRRRQWLRSPEAAHEDAALGARVVLVPQRAGLHHGRTLFDGAASDGDGDRDSSHSWDTLKTACAEGFIDMHRAECERPASLTDSSSNTMPSSQYSRIALSSNRRHRNPACNGGLCRDWITGQLLGQMSNVPAPSAPRSGCLPARLPARAA